MLSFWNETLKNISEDNRKDKFVFIVNKIRFEVSLSYVLGISSLITEDYLKDPTFKDFEIKDQKIIENEFSDFIRGKEIKKETFIKFGKILKNNDMIKKWRKSILLTNETVINYINSNYSKDQDKKNIFFEEKEYIQYIGNHFEDMKEEIKN